MSSSHKDHTFGIGEHLIWSGRPCWRWVLTKYAKWFGLALAPPLLLLVLRHFAEIELAWAGKTFVFWTLPLAAVTLLVGTVMRFEARYTLTSHNIVTRYGILRRGQKKASLLKIQETVLDQSIIERLLRIGKIGIDTAGTNKTEFWLLGLPQPVEIDNAIRAAAFALGEGHNDDDGIARRGPNGRLR